MQSAKHILFGGKNLKMMIVMREKLDNDDGRNQSKQEKEG